MFCLKFASTGEKEGFGVVVTIDMEVFYRRGVLPTPVCGLSTNLTHRHTKKMCKVLCPQIYAVNMVISPPTHSESHL